jgi:hypothetical protein
VPAVAELVVDSAGVLCFMFETPAERQIRYLLDEIVPMVERFSNSQRHSSVTSLFPIMFVTPHTVFVRITGTPHKPWSPNTPFKYWGRFDKQ